MTIPTPSLPLSDSEELPTFDVLPLSEDLRRALAELGYTHPTPVQRAVYEPAVRGHDLIVQARTGTGKTASFGLPLIDSLVRRNQPSVQALILCPTRELALQVHRELEALAKYRSVNVVAIYGGAPMSRQIEQLKAGAQIVVGTPGRVLDHLHRETLSPAQIRVCILDESDEMLSMGFLPQITDILGYLPSPHQTLLFSATLPVDIQRMAETRLNEPVFLTLSGDHVGALEVQHLTYFSLHDKLADFLRVLEVEDPESAIIFCNTKDETKRVAGALDKRGYSAEWLNADLAQSDREKVMESTRKSYTRFLVCTDVAARGIDISHLTHVINFDFPESPEAYVHRTGRTGRAGHTGTAISMITPGDIGFLYMLRLTYKIVPIERQLPTPAELRTRQELDLVEMFAEAFSRRQHHADDLMLARRLLTHESVESVVAGLLRDHLGSRPDSPAAASESRRSRMPRSDSGAARTGNPKQPPGPEESKQAEPARPKQVEPVRSKQVEPVRPKQVEPVRPKQVEPVRQVDIAADGRMEQDRNGNGQRGKPRVNQHSPRQPDEIATEPVGEFDFKYTVRKAEPSSLTNAARVDDADEKPAETSHLRTAPDPVEDDNREIFLTLGRRDGIGPDDVLALLNRHAVPRNAVCYVNVRHHHTFVGVRTPVFESALRALNGADFAGRSARAEPARSTRD